MFQPFLLFLSFFVVSLPSCRTSPVSQTQNSTLLSEKPAENIKATAAANLLTGAEQTEAYLKLLRGKNVALVVNQTSTIRKTHLADSLLAHTIKVVKIFAPEHGFRGEADAGATVKNETDIKTGLPLVSLYGKNKKPSPEQLNDVDVIVFDIQDVGVRFYTYIGTLHYVMEACAENNKPLILLDRPNPNGNYVDGPTLEMQHQSFVGMHPVPLVHGLTIGEFAAMINGESWLTNGKKCNLTVIPLQHYTHQTDYVLPVKPSPNLPNHLSIRLYPSLGLFEGTNVSVGRGTNKQFQVIGSPFYKDSSFSFTPRPMPGAMSPPHLGKKCYGKDLSGTPAANFTLRYLIDFYRNSSQPDKFFNSFFTKLAGTETLRKQIEAGLPEEKIRESWQAGLTKFETIRRKYLLYPDSE